MRERVNEIDLLRFLAALSVVLYHYAFRGHAGDMPSTLAYPLLAPYAKYGYLGVELFFMISGFVILMSAASGSLRAFFISRVTRLYPAYWTCATVTFAVIVLFGAPRFSATLWQYLVNMTMLNGFVHVAHLDGPYWSLVVELKFYALIAVILLAGLLDRALYVLAAWLAVTVAVDFVPQGRLHHLLDVTLTTDFSVYFIAGAVSYLIWAQGVSRKRLVLYAACWLVALRHAFIEAEHEVEYYHAGSDLRVVAAVVSVFFVVMLLVALRRSGPAARRNWVALGALTYPLYLLHETIGYVIFNRFQPVVNPHVLFWGVIALMLAAAYGVNARVERRFAGPFKRFLESRLPGAA